jgi:hypothetical protein
MSFWTLLAVVGTAGAVGGIINALLTDNGFILPHPEDAEHGSILRPGFIGNILIGAVAATISWGLYGPFATAFIIASRPEGQPSPPGSGMSLSSVVGAVLVGIGGAKWLTNEVDKKLLRAAATEAAAGQSGLGASRRIAVASPAEALRIAKSL